MTYGTTLENAERIAAIANAALSAGVIEQPHGREIVRYEPRAHAWLPDSRLPSKWGVWPVWRYTDNPELPEFGGPFAPLSDLAELEN